MKKLALTTAVVVTFVLTSTSVFAVPIGTSNAGRDYLIAAKDLLPWSYGLTAKVGSREVNADGNAEDMDVMLMMGFVGYDILPWVTIYGAAGSGILAAGDDNDKTGSFAMGVGARANLLDQEIMDPTLFEDRIRVNAGAEYVYSQVEINDSDDDFYEFEVSVMISIVNDVIGHKRYLPYAISLYLGPVYSNIEGGADEREEFGFAGGLEVFYTKRVSFEMGMEQFGQDSSLFLFGTQVRF
jgi:hypothetical protein